MRHIPEEELHACLDQALSRSQCVEIESHLARCTRCRASRDEIAALRDRTTALLAKLSPVLQQPPPFDVIRTRYQLATSLRLRRLTRAAWAASVALAVVTGWEANRWLPAHPQPAVSVAPAPVNAPAPAPAAPSHVSRPRPAARAPKPAPAPVPASQAQTGPSAHPPAATSRAAEPQQSAPPLNPANLASEVPTAATKWQSVPVPVSDSAVEPPMPRVSGLPIIQVMVQELGTDEEITAVDQQLASGETIRTIEGPAAKVETLIREEQPSGGGSADGQSQPVATLMFRQGDRIVAVTGPSEVLHSLMSRVMVRQRP